MGKTRILGDDKRVKMLTLFYLFILIGLMYVIDQRIIINYQSDKPVKKSLFILSIN